MSDRDQPLVSVVTPFYNTAAYLAECIESVLAQDYPRLEYVLMDNVSTDGSSDIAARYAARDARIRLVRATEFVGQVPNYNRALASIHPDSAWVKVVEADNSITPTCLTQMVALGEAHPRVGLVGSYCATEHTVRFRGLPRETTVVDGRECARMHLRDGAYLFGAPTTVLMRAGAVRARTPFYDESTWLVEDLSACYALLRDWDFGFVHQVLTFVRTGNEQSIQWERWDYDTMALDRLAVVTRHGADFLSPADHRAALRRTRRAYYGGLAEGALQGKGRRFWEYHRAGLGEIGLRLEPGRLAVHVLRELLSMAANPGRTLSQLRRRRRRQAGPPQPRQPPAGDAGPTGGA